MLLERITTPRFVLCWLAAVCCTVALFWSYELTAGEEMPHPKQWPGHSQIPVPAAKKSLLMFAHPQCGCTTAGLMELKELLQDLPKQHHPQVTFILLQPSNARERWSDTFNESLCRSFEEATILDDPAGEEASGFGVLTSGTCLLYSASGSLEFSGGLTQSRGHRGPNRGRDLLTSRLNAGLSISSHDISNHHHVTFGCPLFSKDDGRR